MTLRSFAAWRRRVAALSAALALAVATNAPARDKLYVGASPGPRVLRVDVSDGAIEIASGTIATGVEGIGTLPGQGWTLLASGFEKDVFRIDNGTGEIVGVGRLAPGQAAFAGTIRGVAGSTNGQIYFTSANSVYQVDSATGLRRLVSGESAGSGPIAQYDKIVVENADSLIVSTRGNFPKLYRVNIATGDRALMSGAPPENPGGLIGAGPALQNLYAMTIAPSGDAIYVNGRREGSSVVDGINGAISRVDLATGDRAGVSNSGLGAGPALWHDDGGLAFVDANTIAATGGYSEEPSILLVDVATGNRTLASGAGVGDGPEFVEPLHVAALPGENAVLVWDEGRQDALRVDLATGDRTIAASNLVGDGPRFGAAPDFDGPHYMAEEDEDTLLVLQRFEPTSPPPTFGISKLLRVDKATGDRSILVDPSVDGGPQIGFYGAVQVLADGRIILVDSNGAPMDVDPTTGTRTQIFGNGEPLDRIRALALDPGTGRLFCVGERKLFRLDADSGDRETLLDYAAAGFSITARAGALASDGRVYVVSGAINIRSVVSFDPLLGGFATAYQPEVVSPPPDSGNLDYAMGLSPLGHPVVFRLQINQFARIDPERGAQVFATESYGRPRPAIFGVDSILLSDDLTLPTQGLVAW